MDRPADRARRLWRALTPPGRPASGAPVLRGRVWLAALGAVLAVVAVGVALDAASLREWPPALVQVGAVVTNLGDSAVYLVPLGIALVVLGLRPPRAWRWARGRADLVWMRLAFLFADVAASGLMTNAAKRLIGRVRPHHLDGEGALVFNPGHWSSRYASFPSGHAETAFAMVTALWLLFGWRAGLASGVVGVAVLASRVVVGAHFPSDVVAGAMVGVVFTLAFAAWLARRGLVFRQTPAGGLAPRPLPRQRPGLRH